MPEILFRPWPWYVAGPLIGLFVPLLLLLGNKAFGISANLRHACAAFIPRKIGHFSYDWREEGGWNLALVAGVMVGGFLAGYVFANPDPITIATATQSDLQALGITDFDGLVPDDLFSWRALATGSGFVIVVVGGFLVGFGTAYAGGCTSGHGLSGIADLQFPSLVALLGFFAGGIIGTFVLLPAILG